MRSSVHGTVLETPALAGWRAYKRLRRRVRTWSVVRRNGSDDLLDPLRVLQVDPTSITEFTHYIDPALGLGRVAGGDWDLDVNTVALDAEYIAMEQVLLGDSRWEDTYWWKRMCEDIEAGKTPLGMTSVSEMPAHVARVEALHASMAEHGYLRQGLLPRERKAGRNATIDEVTVAIGRQGRLLLADGRHRLWLAQMLRLSPMPVQVSLRHEEWAALRKRVAAAVARAGGRAPEPLLHPDLDDVPADERPAALAAAVRDMADAAVRDGGMPISALPIVDLSPGWGYVCARLEREGLNCVAMDPGDRATWRGRGPDAEGGPQAKEFLLDLRAANGSTFPIVSPAGVAIDTLGARLSRLPAGGPCIALLTLRQGGPGEQADAHGIVGRAAVRARPLRPTMVLVFLLSGTGRTELGDDDLRDLLRPFVEVCRLGAPRSLQPAAPGIRSFLLER